MAVRMQLVRRKEETEIVRGSVIPCYPTLDQSVLLQQLERHYPIIGFISSSQWNTTEYLSIS